MVRLFRDRILASHTFIPMPVDYLLIEKVTRHVAHKKEDKMVLRFGNCISVCNNTVIANTLLAQPVYTVYGNYPEHFLIVKQTLTNLGD